MQTVARDEAIRRLNQEINTMGADNLAEAYNELFPSQPTNEEHARRNRDALLARISDHMGRALETEEIVDLWHVVFPRDRLFGYDDELDTFRYDFEPMSAHSTD